MLEYMVFSYGTVLTSYINGCGREGAMAVSFLLIQTVWNLSGGGSVKKDSKPASVEPAWATH